MGDERKCVRCGGRVNVGKWLTVDDDDESGPYCSRRCGHEAAREKHGQGVVLVTLG